MAELPEYFLKKLREIPFVLNWTPVQSCLLLLGYYAFLKCLWICWKVFIVLTPELHTFVFLDIVFLQLGIESIELILSVLLLIICLRFKDTETVHKIMPYLCVVAFTVTLIVDAYLSGIFSVAMFLNTTCYVFIGMFLFHMRVILVALSIATVILSYLVFHTLNQSIRYAPLFNFETIGYPEYLNKFWLLSMAYFSFPVLIACSFIVIAVLVQWRKREKYIVRMGQVDALTGLYNRRMLNEQLLSMEAESNAEALLHAAVMLDLDYFKSVNDTYGHIAGDKVLKKVAQILRENTTDNDLLGRYGGEEFLMILCHTDEQGIRERLERCRIALYEEDHAIAEDFSIKVSGSMGVAFFNEKEQVMDAVHFADQALYSAKSRGRNCICFTETVQPKGY